MHQKRYSPRRYAESIPKPGLFSAFSVLSGLDFGLDCS
jgi:hypothetical protein